MKRPQERSNSQLESYPYVLRRGMTSFENLVALANYQEALRDAKKMVWRDRGEPAVELDGIMECMEHAGRGGLRAAILGFTLRAGFNVFVLLFRISKAPKEFRSSLIRHAIFGQDSFRFAAMLGSFTSLYKLILNTLPLLLPPPPQFADTFDTRSPSPTSPTLPVTMAPTHAETRRGRLSFRAQAHETWVRKKTRRWHAVVAGAVAGGIGIMFEKRSRRIAIGQQLFVRGLQGSYNAYTISRGIRIPNGAIIVFSLCCGQIMYAWLLRPDTIPREYSKWILNASKCAPEGILMNRKLVREGTFDITDLERLINRRAAKPGNQTELFQMLSAAKNQHEFGNRYAPCAVIHPEIDSCWNVPIMRLFGVSKWMFPVYGALHFIPMILFKRSLVMRQPINSLLKALGGTLRSSAFLGVFVVIYQSYFCAKGRLFEYLVRLTASNPRALPSWLKFFVPLLVNKQSFWFGGLLSGLALFVEHKKRREELAMYVLPKGMESAWIMLRGRGWIKGMGELGESLLCAIGMGMVMSTYQNDPQHLSGLVRRIMYQFIGPN